MYIYEKWMIDTLYHTYLIFEGDKIRREMFENKYSKNSAQIAAEQMRKRISQSKTTATSCYK